MDNCNLNFFNLIIAFNSVQNNGKSSNDNSINCISLSKLPNSVRGEIKKILTTLENE